MKSLPGRSAARILSVVGIAGCVVSLLVHTLALLGIDFGAIRSLESGLFFGLVPVFLPAVLAHNLLMSEFSFRDRGLRMLNPKFAYKVWGYVFGKAPKWLRVIAIALFVYAWARSGVFTYDTFSSNSARELGKLQMFSAGTAAFYAAAAAILASYARTERPLGPEEL